jgi:DNA-binding response OmpR family regulator
MMTLMVRMEKVLLRTGRLNRIYRAGDVELDDYRHEVYKAGERVELRPLEYGVLLYLMKHKNLTVTREQLLSEVWGFEYMGESRSVDVKISSLRRKLGLGDAIKTVQKLGYRLEDR